MGQVTGDQNIREQEREWRELLGLGRESGVPRHRDEGPVDRKRDRSD